MRVLIMLPLIFIFTSACATGMQASDIHTEEVIYSAETTNMKGYLAYDKNRQGKRPGVLVVHEWWGHNAYARKRAEMLAEMGYTALAVDMYGDGKTADHPKDAGKFSSAVSKNKSVRKARFLAAKALLENHSTVKADDIAAIGYCFGGGTVLAMAREGVKLDGVASFHGSLGTNEPAQSGAVKTRILVLHGADDPFVPTEQVAAFKQEMENAGVDYKFIAYPGAKHSFTNPGADAVGAKFNLPLQYNAEADTKSWAELQTFLKQIFK